MKLGHLAFFALFSLATAAYAPASAEDAALDVRSEHAKNTPWRLATDKIIDRLGPQSPNLTPMAGDDEAYKASDDLGHSEREKAILRIIDAESPDNLLFIDNETALELQAKQGSFTPEQIGNFVKHALSHGKLSAAVEILQAAQGHSTNIPHSQQEDDLYEPIADTALKYAEDGNAGGAVALIILFEKFNISPELRLRILKDYVAIAPQNDFSFLYLLSKVEDVEFLEGVSEDRKKVLHGMANDAFDVIVRDYKGPDRDGVYAMSIEMGEIEPKKIAALADELLAEKDYKLFALVVQESSDTEKSVFLKRDDLDDVYFQTMKAFWDQKNCDFMMLRVRKVVPENVWKKNLAKLEAERATLLKTQLDHCFEG